MSSLSAGWQPHCSVREMADVIGTGPTIVAMTAAPDPAIENLLRDLTPSVVGAVVRRFGDFAAAEDAVQEARLPAGAPWPREGRPDNPRGWLIQVAARRMTVLILSESPRQ